MSITSLVNSAISIGILYYFFFVFSEFYKFARNVVLGREFVRK